MIGQNWTQTEFGNFFEDIDLGPSGYSGGFKDGIIDEFVDLAERWEHLSSAQRAEILSIAGVIYANPPPE